MNRHSISHKRPAKPALYTAGYEGESVDRFFQKIGKAGVQRIIDVRNNPFSRKPGFSKSSLKSACEKRGLVYLHHPELGIPSRLRGHLKSRADYNKLFDLYKKDILSSTRKSQEQVIENLRTAPSVLVCFEKDPAYCHRSHLAKALSRKRDLEIVHI